MKTLGTTTTYDGTEHAYLRGDLVIGIDSSTTSTKAIAFDARGRIARGIGSELPKILARPGPAAAMPPQCHVGGNAARRQQQGWQSSRQSCRLGFERQVHASRSTSRVITSSRRTPSARAAKLSAMQTLTPGQRINTPPHQPCTDAA